jgi:hypothetical protein
MKFKDYLGDAHSVDEIISMLERDCMPFLKE